MASRDGQTYVHTASWYHIVELVETIVKTVTKPSVNHDDHVSHNYMKLVESLSRWRLGLAVNKPHSTAANYRTWLWTWFYLIIIHRNSAQILHLHTFAASTQHTGKQWPPNYVRFTCVESTAELNLSICRRFVWNYCEWLSAVVVNRMGFKTACARGVSPEELRLVYAGMNRNIIYLI